MAVHQAPAAEMLAAIVEGEEAAGAAGAIPRLSSDHLSWSQAETQLLRELRDSTELLLQEQERIVNRFTQRLQRAKQVAACAVGESTFQGSAHGAAADAGSTTSSDWQRPPAHFKASRGESASEHSQCSEERPGKVESTKRHVLASLQTNFTGWFDDDLYPTSRGPLTRAFWRLHKWWCERKEPERTGRLARFVRSGRFELITLIMIVANGCFIVYETDRCAKIAQDADLAHKDCRGAWYVALDDVFAAYFLVEVLLRLAVHKIYFFCNEDMWWNIFDLLVIGFTVVDIGMYFVGSAADQSDVIFLRILRLFRMTRSLRFFRALHFVRQLRQLMECMVASLSGVFWCMLLLVFITGIFATFLVQCATNLWTDPRHTRTQEDEALAWAFGSVTDAMLSLFKATSGGDDWGAYLEILTSTGFVGPLIFIMYILFFIIAAWNVVTSLFIEKALTLAQPDLDKQMLEKRRQDIADAKSLLSLIQSIDDDNSGTISMHEFKKMLDQPHFRGFFELRNIDIKDAEVFFCMLQTASGSRDIQLDAVVNGLMRMRGIASNLDLQGMQFQMNMNQDANLKYLHTLHRELHGVVSELRSISQSTAALARESHRNGREEVCRRGQKSVAMQLVQKDIERLSFSP